MTIELTARWNSHCQAIVIPAATAHLPHVEVIWYAGGIYASGHTYVAEGETEMQAAERAFGDRFDGKTVVVRPEPLFEEYPR